MLRSLTSLRHGARRALSTTAAKPPVTLAITGAAGSIGYALVMRAASGQIFGPDQPINLSLIEVEPRLSALKGVTMEIQDGAFPLLRTITQTSDLNEGFGDCDAALLVGATPRGPGMERGDLLGANAAIFAAQGKALNSAAKKDVKVLVVGNPANTNALVAAANAPDLNPGLFAAMTRLDQSRALAQVSNRINEPVRNLSNLVIWGNHSATQFPDLSSCIISPSGESVADRKEITHEWITSEFIPRVQKRGAEIISARGASSAASAAAAAIDSLKDWVQGRDDADWQSLAVRSDGAYGVDKDIWYSVPVTHQVAGEYARVLDVPSPDEFAAAMMTKTKNELLEERDAVRHLLPADGVKATAAKGGRKKKTKKASA